MVDIENNYQGDGLGQCIAIIRSGDERCQNAVFYPHDVCYQHNNSNSYNTVIEVSDSEWVNCKSCGWQEAEETDSGTLCGWCGEKTGTNRLYRKGGMIDDG